MFKSIGLFAAFNEQTGYGNHATNFARELEKLIPVNRNTIGDVNISLLDVVSAAHETTLRPFPSILYNAWESTEYPAEFLDKMPLYNQLWVPSEWQRACSIAQGIPEEVVKVVPEGVDPEIFKPGPDPALILGEFNFLMVGKWEPRKSNLEVCQSFLAAFPADLYPNVRLYLSCDTLFNCDEYKSTEERLQAYGISDSRIIIVHFEERDAYIGRLQASHVFVSCSRAEGWGLPIIESMACGVPTIVADWSGSTEYAFDALKVRVVDFKKPKGIFGNWDVPGVWGEPDYNHLIEVMKDAYENYSAHKEKALVTSEMIRTKFSWEAAAKKAYAILEELSATETPVSINSESEIRAYARSRGYEITSLQPRKAIFAVDCWPNTQEKLDTLSETISQIHTLGYPVLVSSHFSLPPAITSLCDYYLYEKRDLMSGDDHPIYWRTKLDGTIEKKRADVEYQGVAAINCFRNAIDFCRGKFDWIYQMGADMEVDLPLWLSLVHASSKPMVCIPYEGIRNGIGGGLWAGRTDVLDKVIPYLNSWEEYALKYPEVRFVAERWLFNHVSTVYDMNEIDWIDISTQNRFDNVDRNIWADDEFFVHFLGGPYVEIMGISNREYEVIYINPIDGEHWRTKQKAGSWSRPLWKFYRDWTILVALDNELKFSHKFDLSDKRVLISMGSKALGDTIAWMPYVEEFRKKHNCHIICSGWWNMLFDYPEIEFVTPGSEVADVYASYDVGCFDNQFDRNPSNWRTVPLQKVAADILGLDYKPLRAKLKYKPYLSAPNSKPYICFSEFSTMKNKMWNREGAWQKIIDYLISLGYDCVSISTEPSELKNVILHNGQDTERTLADISGAEFYVGLNHGPIWMAYSMDIPVIMITGVSEEFNDFPNPYRISVDVGCKPCFNNAILPIDRGWEWCVNKDKFVCTREITEDMVIKMIDKVISDKKVSKTKLVHLVSQKGVL